MTRSASAKPASMSPIANSTRLATFEGLLGAGSTPAVNRSSWSKGASSAIAWTTSMTCGRTSYSTSISFRACLAIWALVAATAATGWPS